MKKNKQAKKLLTQAALASSLFVCVPSYADTTISTHITTPTSYNTGKYGNITIALTGQLSMTNSLNVITVDDGNRTITLTADTKSNDAILNSAAGFSGISVQSDHATMVPIEISPPKEKVLILWLGVRMPKLSMQGK